MSKIGNLTYNLFMLPFEKAVLHKFRKTSVSEAYGDVLEIGIGTGINTGYFNTDRLKSITVLDTQIRMTAVNKLKKKLWEQRRSHQARRMLICECNVITTCDPDGVKMHAINLAVAILLLMCACSDEKVTLPDEFKTTSLEKNKEKKQTSEKVRNKVQAPDPHNIAFPQLIQEVKGRHAVKAGESHQVITAVQVDGNAFLVS